VTPSGCPPHRKVPENAVGAVFDGMRIDVNAVDENAKSLMDSTESPMTALVRAVHFEKASVPMEMTESGIEIETRDEHSLNASVAKDVSSLEKMTDVILEQPKNAPKPTVITEFGMITAVSDKQ